MIDNKRTGERIQRACERRGITVPRLQRELNVGAFQSIYNWFSGKTLPALENFYGLSRLLHVPMESLIVLKGSLAGMERTADRCDSIRLIACGGVEIPVQMEHAVLERLAEESDNRLREYEAAFRKKN